MIIQPHQRGRNTTQITGAGPDSVKANSNQTANGSKFKSYGGRPLQYVMPNNKKQSTLTLEQASRVSGYESQASVKAAQDAQIRNAME